MHWNSTEQIATYFDLLNETDGESQSLKKAISKKLAQIHPDKNGNEFANPETEHLWHELQSAKEFVEKVTATEAQTSEHQLIPISQMTELVRLITQSNSQPFETRLSSLKIEAREDARAKGMIPRIGSGVFAAVSAFLFTFSSSAKDHPLLGQWLQTSIAQYMLLAATLYSGMFFLMTWSRERRQETLVEFLSSEEGLRKTLANLFSERLHREENPRRFTLRELTAQLRPSYHREHSSVLLVLLGGQSISLSVADKIASLHVERLSKRGVIIELPQKALDRMFEVSRATFDELTKHRLA